jgi:hypothetical protein
MRLPKDVVIPENIFKTNPGDKLIYRCLSIKISRKLIISIKMKPKIKKFLERVRKTIHLKHYSQNTEQAYLNWIKQYILFNNKKHPLAMAASEIEAYLTYLAIERKAAASMES